MSDHLQDLPIGAGRSDGQAGAPLIAVPSDAVPTAPVNTPGAPNSALKETPKPGDGVQLNHEHAAHLRVVDADLGIIGTADGSPRRKKIAICGFASSTRRYIPVHDPSWEIWGLNQLYRHIPRADVWFDIHYNWDKEIVPGTDHRGWLRDCGMPVYLLERNQELPTSVRFPIEALLQTFEADYFTSSIAYMTALGIMEIDRQVRLDVRNRLLAMDRAESDRVVENMPAFVRACYGQHSIGIFGVDLVVEEEYFWQKPCAEFWIGQGASRGINMVIPRESALCKHLYRYGYDPEPQSLIRVSDIQGDIGRATAARDEQLKRLWVLEGIIQADERWKQLLELRQRGTTVEIS